MKILFAVTGASGASLGLKAYELAPKEHTKHLIISDNAEIVLAKEEGKVYKKSQFWQAPASGSYGMDSMLIAPCSANTLAKIACGIADNLVTRSASVMLKEKKRLVIAPREMPFDEIMIENMLRLAKMGVIIAPPVMAYYGKQKSLDEMESFVVGKWLDLMGVSNNLYNRWS